MGRIVPLATALGVAIGVFLGLVVAYHDVNVVSEGNAPPLVAEPVDASPVVDAPPPVDAGPPPVDAAPPRPKVIIKVEPERAAEKAKAYLDGDEVPIGEPFEVPLAAGDEEGRFKLKVSASGYRSYRKTLTLKVGDEEVVEVKLRRRKQTQGTIDI